MSPEGYKIRKRGGQSCICTDCTESLGINLSESSDVSTLDTTMYASHICICCDKDITRGNGGNIENLAESIAILVNKAFEDMGERFGGVNAVIDTEFVEKDIADGVSFNKSIQTSCDPVIVRLYPNEKDIYNKLCSFLDKMRKKDRIWYKSDIITDEDENVMEYVITIGY